MSLEIFLKKLLGRFRAGAYQDFFLPGQGQDGHIESGAGSTKRPAWRRRRGGGEVTAQSSREDGLAN